jgi:hypothetical protein
MNKLQKGGLDPLIKVPSFKYTFNEKRKLFIGYLYPYAEYFINCVTSIPFNSYSYNGECEYINPDDKKQIVTQCSSNNSPLYFFSGGTAYEILNKNFNNVNMHKYCDATSDIDVSLYPPNLTYNENGEVYFFNIDGKISSFYSNFTKWAFENMVKNVESIKMLFTNMDHIVNFNIDEYHDIPNEHKTSDFGYNIQMIGQLYVVAFLNEDKTMFKIQVVCKIEDSDIFVIDHVIEIIIPLPETNIEFAPSGDGYSPPKISTITINTKSFNIQNYASLINDNVDAYINRKQVFGSSNENDNIHKPINHIARIFYLFELMYQNQKSFQIDKIPLLFLPMTMQSKQNKEKMSQLEFMYYYKIVDGKFNIIKIDTRFFLNSYLELISKNTYLYNMFKRNNPNYFINDSVDNIKKLHDRFNTELFNDNLFQPSGLLTFSETIGGKRRKKTRKLRKIHKLKRTRKLGKVRKTKKHIKK